MLTNLIALGYCHPEQVREQFAKFTISEQLQILTLLEQEIRWNPGCGLEELRKLLTTN